MAGDQAGVHLLGPVDNLQGFRDDGTAAPRLAPDAPPNPAPLLVLAQGLHQRCLQPATGLGVDHRVDGLVAHAGLGVIRMHGPQCRRDLLGRPAEFDEVVPDKAPKHAPRNELAPRTTAPSTPLIGAKPPLGAVTPQLQRLPPPTQLPADRARRPPQKPRNLALAAPATIFGKHDRPFRLAQMMKPHDAQLHMAPSALCSVPC